MRTLIEQYIGTTGRAIVAAEEKIKNGNKM